MRNENATVRSCGRGDRACRGRLAAGAAVLALLLCQAAATFAGVDYNAWGNYNQGGDAYFKASDNADAYLYYSSNYGMPPGGGMMLADGESYASAAGRADAASLKMGIAAMALSTPANSQFTDAYIETRALNRFEVLPGSSGLAAGDRTRLIISTSLEGTLYAEARSWPGKGWTHADINGGLTIRDDAIGVETGEGTTSRVLASFGATSELEASDIYLPYWKRSYSGEWSESWSTQSNTQATDSHSNSGKQDEVGERTLYQASRYFNTGRVSLEFEAIVGHTLDLNAYLNSYVNANNDGRAWADFSHTFTFDVTPEVEGVELKWEVVPEPGSLSIMGLAALAALRRRRR